MARNPIPIRTVHRYQPALLAQFDRNKNRASTIRGGRAYGACLHLTSPMVRVCKPKPIGGTPTAPWNLQRRLRMRLLTTVIGVAAIGFSAGAFAQSPEQSRQQSVQAARYGAALGLPRDGQALYLPDEAYPRFPLPPGNAAYAHVDGLKMKEVVEQIAAISRKSRDDGNQYWGRIPGTPYDRMAQDWVMSRFQALGLQEVRRQAIAMKPLWYPTAWSAEFTAGGKTIPLKSAFPITESPPTKGRVSAPVVWVGLGTAADFRGRDVAGKAVMIYSIATPGGRDHTADWSGAVKRADEAGAAIIMVEMGFPGDSQSEPEGAVGARAPTITITPDDANLIRDRLDANVDVELHLKLDTEEREGLETANVWGVMPGASDEQVLIMAHTDAFFEGAMDNASGIAMMLDIARHYADLPQAQRPRTLVFLTTSDHHHGSVGIRSVRDSYDWSKVALIVNCEHPSQTLLYN